MKRVLSFFLPAVLAVALSGCNTLKGTAKGAAEGFRKDVSGAWDSAVKADQWLQRNAW